MSDIETRLALIEKELSDQNKEIINSESRIIQKIEDLEGKVVLRVEFRPVQSIVFGAITLIVITVFTAIVGLVVTNGS